MEQDSDRDGSAKDKRNFDALPKDFTTMVDNTYSYFYTPKLVVNIPPLPPTRQTLENEIHKLDTKLEKLQKMRNDSQSFNSHQQQQIDQLFAKLTQQRSDLSRF